MMKDDLAKVVKKRKILFSNTESELSKYYYRDIDYNYIIINDNVIDNNLFIHVPRRRCLR